MNTNKMYMIRILEKTIHFLKGNTTQVKTLAKYFDCYRLTFTIEAEIGGYLTMEHREKQENETHNLIGTTKTLQYVFRWDYVEPYHCVKKETNIENCVNPLTVPDLTEQVRFI